MVQNHQEQVHALHRDNAKTIRHVYGAANITLFISDIFWECPSLGAASIWFPHGSADYEISPGKLGGIRELSRSEADEYWRDIVDIYSRCALSFPDKDKLLAVEGVMRQISRFLNSSVHHGFIQAMLPEALCWQVSQVYRDGGGVLANDSDPDGSDLDRMDPEQSSQNISNVGKLSFTAATWHWAYKSRPTEKGWSPISDAERLLLCLIPGHGPLAADHEPGHSSPLVAVGKILPVVAVAEAAPETTPTPGFSFSHHVHIRSFSDRTSTTDLESDAHMKSKLAIPACLDDNSWLWEPSAAPEHISAVLSSIFLLPVVIEFDRGNARKWISNPELASIDLSSLAWSNYCDGLLLRRSCDGTYKRIGNFHCSSRNVPLPFHILKQMHHVKPGIIIIR